MDWKPKITRRNGVYECRGERFVGYGETPLEAWRWWYRAIKLTGPRKRAEGEDFENSRALRVESFSFRPRPVLLPDGKK